MERGHALCCERFAGRYEARFIWTRKHHGPESTTTQLCEQRACEI
jgi:hypothetical protein